jgi:hypothetical protein
MIAVETDVLGVPHVANPAVSGRHFARDISCVVVRRVIADHDLETPIVLPDNRIQRIAQASDAISRRDTD